MHIRNGTCYIYIVDFVVVLMGVFVHHDVDIHVHVVCVSMVPCVLRSLAATKRAGVFFLSSARRCVWSALLEQLFQAAHTNIHEIFFMSVHHPKLLGTNVDRNFGALRSQA